LSVTLRLPGILEMSGETERRTLMLFLVLAAIFFAGIHLGVAGTTWGAFRRQNAVPRQQSRKTAWSFFDIATLPSTLTD